MTTVTGNEDLIYMAKIAEQAERYDEMVNFMKQFVQAENKLSVEQRNLLSVAYKNVIGARRASWRIISSIEQKEESKGHADQVLKIKEYRKKIEEELYVVCNDILDLLSTSLLAKADTDEEKVFYFKMQGDYYRYIAEYASGDKRKEAADSAREAYDNASKTAEHLATTNPIRLGLALNYSVFYYEILNSPETACTLARDAFDSAIAQLEQVEEESYKDSTLIMQLLRDNLTLWTSDLQDEADKPDMNDKSDNEE